MRKTMKFLRASYLIAVKYQKSMGEVVRAETNASNVYLELAADGYVWDTHEQEWLLKNPPASARASEPPPAQALQYLPISLRIMGQDNIDVQIAADVIAGLIRDAKGQIYRISEPKANRDGDGARLYMEIGL